MIKLERIYVQNFKNITEADLPLGDMNVIVGENNAGKSNLLQVVPFLNYLINGPVNEVKQGFEGIGATFKQFNQVVRMSSLSKPIEPMNLGIEFSNIEEEIIYSYNAVIESVEPSKNNIFMRIAIKSESFSGKSKTKTGRASNIFDRNMNSVEYGSGIKKDAIITQIDNHISVVRLLTLIKTSDKISHEYKQAIEALEKVLGSQIFYLSPQLLKEYGNNYENHNRIAQFNLDDEIAILQTTSLWNAYLDSLRKILSIDNITIIDTPQKTDKQVRGKTVIYRHLTEHKVTQIFSDGSVLMLALITKLYRGESDIFFIEEPENSIHPKALHELIKLMRRFIPDRQFIVTTHSLYLLNMMKPEEVIVATLDKKGRSTIAKLPDVKAIKRKLAKGFMDFGDLVFDESLMVE